MVNVFSFCLFGSPSNTNKHVETDIFEDVLWDLGGYYHGLVENIKLVNRHYPGWYIYVYLGDDVPEWFAQKLLKNYRHIVIRRTGVLGFKNTVHRFFAIDEPGVDAMFVRDCDDRVNWKDRWAIDYFMKQTRRNLLIIRDHKEHNGMAAGTWGTRKSALKKSIRSLFDEWTPVFAGSGDPENPHGYGIDQNFLSNAFYSLHVEEVLVIHSFGKVYKYEIGVNFPYRWTNDVYVGRIETPADTENRSLRERDTPPPEEIPIVVTDKSVTTPPEKPLSFLHRRAI